MRSDQIPLASRLLLDAMRGASCESLAAAHKLGPSQVWRLCEELATRAHADGLLPGVQPEVLRSLRRLRSNHAELVIKAVSDYQPNSVGRPRANAKLRLDEDRIEEGLSKLRSRSTHPLRDAAMLCTLVCTGLRPIEIARLQVSDCLDMTGVLKQEVSLREEVAQGGRPRTVYFTTPRLTESLDAYLSDRALKEAGPRGAARGRSYRGLDPSSGLFKTDRGIDFRVHARPGGGSPLCPRAFEVFAKIFVEAGWPGMSSSAVRRHLRTRLLERDAHRDEVALMLDCDTSRCPTRPRGSARPIGTVAMDL